jgi:hypothetical protein
MYSLFNIIMFPHLPWNVRRKRSMNIWIALPNVHRNPNANVRITFLEHSMVTLEDTTLILSLFGTFDALERTIDVSFLQTFDLKDKILLTQSYPLPFPYKYSQSPTFFTHHPSHAVYPPHCEREREKERERMRNFEITSPHWGKP